MRIGLQVPNFTYPGGAPAIAPVLGDIARTADEAGFYSLWVMDHFFQIGGPGVSWLGPPEDFMLECYTTLGHLAGITQRVMLGALVVGVVYRHPGILVKTHSTLDVLSGGRTYFGIGAAWNERESRALGVPFPPLAERFERLEEAILIAKQMWSGKAAPYHGRHYQLAETLNSPQPLARPHPPIMIGGGGEKKTLKLVAQYADACNLFMWAGVDGVRAKLDVLRRHCDAVGRDYASIEKTILATVHLAPGKQAVKDVIEMCRGLARIGVTHAIFNLPNAHDIEPIRACGREIIPAVAAL